MRLPNNWFCAACGRDVESNDVAANGFVFCSPGCLKKGKNPDLPSIKAAGEKFWCPWSVLPVERDHRCSVTLECANRAMWSRFSSEGDEQFVCFACKDLVDGWAVEPDKVGTYKVPPRCADCGHGESIHSLHGCSGIMDETALWRCGCGKFTASELAVQDPWPLDRCQACGQNRSDPGACLWASGVPRHRVLGAPVAAHDPVSHPAHYTFGKLEVIEVIEDWGWGLHFCLGNTVKYVARAGRKDPKKMREDLEKARWYLDRAIQIVAKAAR